MTARTIAGADRRAATGTSPGQLPVRQRRPGLIALAVALIAVCASIGAWLYLQAGQRTPVVVLATDVPYGHVIERSDLTTVAVAGSISAVPAQGLDGVVGQTAAVHLLRGTVLQRSMVTRLPAMSEDSARVGVAVSGAQIPADGLTIGATADVLRVPPRESSAGARTGAQLLTRAEVFAARPDPAQAGGTLLTLVVPVDDVLRVAEASAAGQVALVEVAPS